MFEDSLFSSKASTRSAGSRWATIMAAGVQGGLVAWLLVAPMLRPLALPMLKTAPAVVSVNLRKPTVKPEPQRVRPEHAEATAFRVPSSSSAPVEPRQGGRITMPQVSGDEPPMVSAAAVGFGGSGGDVLGFAAGAGPVAEPAVRVTTRSALPVRISSGVSSGMLLRPILPAYPVIARSAHVEGTVVITARIDRSGRIVGLQVVSGPEMLRNAAVDAVKEARYRPYLLNGEATEVETTIAVNFRMGS